MPLLLNHELFVINPSVNNTKARLTFAKKHHDDPQDIWEYRIWKVELFGRCLSPDDMAKSVFTFNHLLNKCLPHLAICDGVVIDSHLWVDVFKVPAETPTLQPFP